MRLATFWRQKDCQSQYFHGFCYHFANCPIHKKCWQYMLTLPPFLAMSVFSRQPIQQPFSYKQQARVRFYQYLCMVWALASAWLRMTRRKQVHSHNNKTTRHCFSLCPLFVSFNHENIENWRSSSVLSPTCARALIACARSALWRRRLPGPVQQVQE